MKASGSGDQIGDIGRVLGIMLIPASIEKLPVVFDRTARDQDNVVAASDQMSAQRLVVIAGRLQAKDNFAEAVSNSDSLNMGQQLGKTIYGVFKDQSSEKGLASGSAQKGMMLVLGNIYAHD
jgi:hypothetical protein